MKTLKLILIAIAFLSISAKAQVGISVNIGSPPLWGPVGYSEARYYYLPDVEGYYDVRSSMFIYYEGGVWVHRAYLPQRYRNYDLYGGYKVVMRDYHGDAPYEHFREYKTKYGRGYHGERQRTIGERPGRGNSGDKNFHHDNRGGRSEGRGGPKNVEHGNERGNPHGNDKGIRRENGHGNNPGNGQNKQEEHGHEGGKGKKN